jgi:hypothetical protein
MELKHWLIVFALMTTIIFTVMFVESAAFVRLGYANSLGDLRLRCPNRSGILETVAWNPLSCEVVCE